MEFENINPNDTYSKKSKGINPCMLNKEVENDKFINNFQINHQEIMSNLAKKIETNEQEEEIKSLTAQNIEIMKNIFTKQQQIKEVSDKIKNEFIEFQSYNHALELDELGNVCGRVNTAKEKMHKLVADLFKAMYEGVLIPGEISIRHHRICPFRCQSRISDSEFFNMIRTKTSQETILKTLTNCEQQKVVKQLFEVMKLLDDNRTIIEEDPYGRNSVCEMIIPLEEPLLFIDKLGDMKFRLVTEIKIRNYSITFNGYDLMDFFEGKTEEEILKFISNEYFLTRMKQLSEQSIDDRMNRKRQVSLSNDNYKYFINNFGDYIVKVGKELEKLYSFKADFLDKAIVQIQTIGSKYLIADQLSRQIVN